MIIITRAHLSCLPKFFLRIFNFSPHLLSQQNIFLCYSLRAILVAIRFHERPTALLSQAHTSIDDDADNHKDRFTSALGGTVELRIADCGMRTEEKTKHIFSKFALPKFRTL